MSCCKPSTIGVYKHPPNPIEHESLVQTRLSLQYVELIVLIQVPVVELHVSIVQLIPSLQLIGVDVQTSLIQVSEVQGLLSLQ